MSGTEKIALLRAVVRVSLHHRAVWAWWVGGRLSSCVEDSSLQQSPPTGGCLSGELEQGTTEPMEWEADCGLGSQMVMRRQRMSLV